MGKLINIGFEFNGVFYYTLIHMRPKDGWNEYVVTVMNGKLERLLYGNHVIKEINGQVIEDVTAENTEQKRLKVEIAKALNEYLRNTEWKK